MQAPTHILTGVIIQKSAEAWLRRRWVVLTVTAVVAFLSHGLLDRLADITYHPANPEDNWFWALYHLGVLITTIVFLVIWWRRYKWGVTFAVLPDLDWVFIHGQNIFKIRGHFYRKPYMHDFLHIIFNDTAPFSYINMPNHRHNPWASLYEVALILLLLAVIWNLPEKRSPTRAA